MGPRCTCLGIEEDQLVEVVEPRGAARDARDDNKPARQGQLTPLTFTGHLVDVKKKKKG